MTFCAGLQSHCADLTAVISQEIMHPSQKERGICVTLALKWARDTQQSMFVTAPATFTSQPSSQDPLFYSAKFWAPFKL